MVAVLILILLEYGLRHYNKNHVTRRYGRLNPYSIGIWSATQLECVQRSRLCVVLILILLEYGLRHNQGEQRINTSDVVLILILLEYGLRPLKSQTIDLQILKI